MQSASPEFATHHSLAAHDAGLTAADLATIIGGVAAAVGLAGYVRSLWRRTFGRRRDIGRRLNRLGTGAQLQFFESVLGEPPAIRRSFELDQVDWGAATDEAPPPIVRRSYVESFFVDPDYWLQTVSDEDGSVAGFSVTTRRRRFHPTLTFPLPPTHRERAMEWITLGRRKPRFVLARVELGRTKFARAVKEEFGFPRINAWMGARAASYTEVWSFGNPGHYQDYAFTWSTTPAVGEFIDTIELVEWDDDEGNEGPWLEHDETPEDWRTVAPEWIRNWHEKSVITTVTVIGPGLSAEEWPGFGPHGDEVRRLP